MHTTMYPIEKIFWYIIRCGQNNSFFPSKITNFGCYEFCSVTNLQIWRAGVHPTLCNVFILQSKPSRKIETAKRHLLELSWPLQRLRSKLYFFRNKTFFVFQDKKLKLSASVWKRILWNLTKFQLNQLI